MNTETKAISIRGLEKHVAEKIKLMAQENSKSINQYLIDLINKHVGIQKEKKYTKTYNDLDHLFGKWSDPEYEQVNQSIDSQRQIDQELWK